MRSIGKIRSIAVVFVSLLAACVTAPAYRAPDVRVPTSYDNDVSVRTARPSPDSCPPDTTHARAAADTVPVRYTPTLAAAPFWRELGDSTLSQLIAEALQANTDIRIAASRLTIARSSRRLAAFDLAPTITASGSSTRQQLSIAQLPGTTAQFPEQQLWDVGFDASWELDLFGRVRQTVGAQSALVASAEYNLRDVQVSLVSEVARTYFELRGAQQQLAVAERNAENQRRTVSLTQDRLAAGRGTAFDTERARSELYLTLSTTPTIETQIAQQRRRIAVLLGRAPESLPTALLANGDLPRLPDSLNVGSPADLVQHRPDVLRAERQAAAQRMLVGAARSDYLPRVTFAARAGYAATTFDSLTRRGTSRFLFGPVLSWPFLDIGRVRQRVDLAQAQVEEADAQHTATALRALEEAEVAMVSYDRAHARLAFLDEAVRASVRAASLAQQRFEAGLTDFLQVLDAQRTLLDAENQLARGRTDAAVALVAVYKSVGGTWPVR